MLGGEPSAQSEVLSSVEQVFIEDISVLCPIQLSLNFDQSPSPCCNQHTLFLGWYSAGDVQTWFPSNMMLRIEVNQTRLCFLQIPSVISCVFTEERIEFGHTAIKPRSVDCCSDVCPSVGFSHLHISTWSSTRRTIRFLITSLDKALLHQFELSLAGRPPLGRVLVVANIFHLRIMETTVLLGKVQKFCLYTIRFLSSAGSSFDFTAWFSL